MVYYSDIDWIIPFQKLTILDELKPMHVDPFLLNIAKYFLVPCKRT